MDGHGNRSVTTDVKRTFCMFSASDVAVENNGVVLQLTTSVFKLSVQRNSDAVKSKWCTELASRRR